MWNLERDVSFAAFVIIVSSAFFFLYVWLAKRRVVAAVVARVPLWLLVAAFLLSRALDLHSTYRFVQNEGPKYEGNVLARFVFTQTDPVTGSVVLGLAGLIFFGAMYFLAAKLLLKGLGVSYPERFFLIFFSTTSYFAAASNYIT